MVLVPELEALAEAPLTCELMRETRKREMLTVKDQMKMMVALKTSLRL